MSTTNSVDDFYANHYENVLNSGAVGFVSEIMHKSLENYFERDDYFPKTLELGAGLGQHLSHVKHKFDEYLETDIRADNLPNRGGGGGRISRDIPSSKIRQKSVDAQTLKNIDSDSIDRIIATCLIIHLPEPEPALANWRRVIKSGGHITIYVPCEPGLVLRFLRSLTTRRKAAKRGVNHDSVHHREHTSYFGRINTLVFEVFNQDLIKRKFFPLRIHSWNLNLWVTYQIKIIKSKEYL